MSQIDALAVALPARRPLEPGEIPPHTNAIRILEWSLDRRNLQRECARCERWDGLRADQAKTTVVRTPETSERPPGAQRRDSCTGCFVSFFLGHQDAPPEPEEADDQAAALEAWRAARACLDKHREHAKHRARMYRRWRALMDEVLEYERQGRGGAARAFAETQVPLAERTLTEKQLSRMNTEKIKLKTRLNAALERCLELGVDPVQAAASGALLGPTELCEATR